MAERVGPAGKALAANISRIRKARGLTFAEVSARTEEIGQPIAILGLRRIERGERRVDYDDLLTLAVALGVAPVDLMVPDVSNKVPFPLPGGEVGCATAREWVRGHLASAEGSDLFDLFTNPLTSPDVAELAELLRWMPEDRRRVVLRHWAIEEYEDDEEDES
jgi:transcriptional regulator with XRE-family HTH domain